jgi:hypothetical protein
MALTTVTLKEIERIFEILDRLGISREAVVIPLRPVHPGGVRILANGKLEIQVESETPFEEWLPELERMITDVMRG